MKKFFFFVVIIFTQMSFASEDIDLDQIYKSDFKINTLINNDNWAEIGEISKFLLGTKAARLILNAQPVRPGTLEIAFII